METRRRLQAENGNADGSENRSGNGNESFNDWGGARGCNKFVPVLEGDSTKITPPGDLLDQPLGKMS